MFWEKFFGLIIDPICRFGFPTVCFYHIIAGNLFLNVAANDAEGLEKWGDVFLTPTQYLLAGREAIHRDGSFHEEWEFVQRFDYMDRFWLKTAASMVVLPPSLILGCLLKGAAYVASDYSPRYASMKQSLNCSVIYSNNEAYRTMGLAIIDPGLMDTFASEGLARKKGDEHHLAKEREALQEIANLLNCEKIPWWVDCGTCLGAYRYGGTIPWDGDIDIAVLLPDFENVFRILKRLDKSKYFIFDWSGREHPKSGLMVYLKETGSFIDIYHFAIDEKKRQLRYVLSLENNLFMSESWRIRERRFKAPVAFEDVFPLKKALFDNVEIFVPQNTKKYLQRYYGENLAPAKIFDPITGCYEKDLSHPYWQNAHAH